MKISPAPVEGEGEDAASLPASSTDKRTLSQQVTPLCDMTYEDQIDFKRQLLLGSLERATRKLYAEAANGSGLEWVRQLAKGPICPLETMHHSPDLNGYRNKNEFTIGYAEDGKPMVTEILKSECPVVFTTCRECNLMTFENVVRWAFASAASLMATPLWAALTASCTRPRRRLAWQDA